MSQSRVSPKQRVEHNPGTVCCSVAAIGGAQELPQHRLSPPDTFRSLSAPTPAVGRLRLRLRRRGRPLLVGDQLLQGASRSRSKVGDLCRAAARRAGSPRTSGPTDVTWRAPVGAVGRRRRLPGPPLSASGSLGLPDAVRTWMAPIYRVGVNARPLCVACGSAVGGPPPPAADCEKS